MFHGEVKQDASTGQMIFRVPEIVAFISTLITLEPGDVILTGTPEGVGLGRKPPVYRKAGEKCVRCAGTIRSIRQPPSKRATYFCPRRQQ